jgi:hypothetical protein
MGSREDRVSDVVTLSQAQVAALTQALERAEAQAMSTLRRTDQDVQLIMEDERSEPGTVHEAIASIVTDLHEVYAAVAELGVQPLYPGWTG